MKNYRLIPLPGRNLRYLPAILTCATCAKHAEEVLVYIPVLANPEADFDQDPIVSEDT